ELVKLNGTSTGLRLPDPSKIGLVEVRETVIPAILDERQWILTSGSLDDAERLRRGIEAYRKWGHDRKCRGLLDAECRRTEVLIGELLGPTPDPEETGAMGGRGKKGSPAGEPFDSLLDKDDRYKCRLECRGH